MRNTSSTRLRQNLSAELDRVIADGEPLIVHRNGNKGAVVMVPLGKFEMDETDYLLSSPANAKRLMDAIRSLDAGKTVPFKLPDED